MKFARTESRQKRDGKKFKKQIYDIILSNNYNSLNLQKLEEFINDVTPRNPYGQHISERIPQGVERSLYEGKRKSVIIETLFSRIFESTVPANERFSESGRRKIEERKKEALKAWAQATGNWHTDLSKFVTDTEPIGGGTDSDVYIANDGHYVIKVSKGKPFNKRFHPDTDQIALFNHVFPNTAYEILGYGEIDGKFVKILKQPLVNFSTCTPLSIEE